MLYTVLRCRAVWLHWMYCDVLLHWPTLRAGHSVSAVLTNTTPFCAVLLQSVLHWNRVALRVVALVARMLPFSTLPEELQGGCARFLDTTSAGRFSRTSKACWRLVDAQLVAAKAARAAKPFEKSAHGGIITYRNPNEGSKLLTFSGTDGGHGGHFVCWCARAPRTRSAASAELSSTSACHLTSRNHWKHWRLVAFGEAQPTEAAWRAFAATIAAR